MVIQTNTQEHPTPRYLSVHQTCIAQRSVLAEVDMFSSLFLKLSLARGLKGWEKVNFFSDVWCLAFVRCSFACFQSRKHQASKHTVTSLTLRTTKY
mgnify:CR=1 FL=1